MTRREREVTDPKEQKRILDTCKIVHLGLVDKGMPYIVPMNYGYEFEGDKLVLYMHCGKVGYKLDVIRENPVCCFEMECNVLPFPGDVACQYGTAYESLMGRGKASIIEDVEEIKRDLSIFMKCQTGKDFEFNDKMVSAVYIIKIQVDEYTAKRRPIPEGIAMNMGL